MTGVISQMQMAYNPEEDRILFRVNSSDNKEYRLWLTRRFTTLVLKVLQAHLNCDPDVSAQGTPEARQAVKEFKQEQAMSSANFKDEFREGSKELPLGNDPLLACTLTYKVTADNLQLGIQPRQGQGVTIAINHDVNLSMTRLLLAAANKGDWKLGDEPAHNSVDKATKRIIN